ncbi:cell division FtsZ family protein [bacterium]|nr:cell division FtsZ family protein [bacterium]
MKQTKEIKARTIKLHPPKIKIIGIGGGGSSIVEEIAKIIRKKKIPFLSKIDFIAANVDLQAIKSASKTIKTIYFGEDVTFGLGCGMNPELGKTAAFKSKEKLQKELKNCDFCILISCLGGGTGSGAAPIIAQIIESMKIPTLGIFTTPFKFEGSKRIEIARGALKNIKPLINAYVVISNQKIFGLIKPQTTLQNSLSLMNKVLAEILEGLLEIIYLPGLINIDFADLKTVLKEKGEKAFLATATAKGSHKPEKAINALFQNPLLETKSNGYDKILFNIAATKDIKMREVEEICKAIYEKNPKAKIIFGISHNLSGKDQIKITFLAIEHKEEKPKKKQKIKKIKQLVKMDAEKKGTERKTEKKQKPTKDKSKLVKKKIAVPKKERRQKGSAIVEKPRVRRNALDVHKLIKEAEKELLEEEKKWETPAFLRKKPTK